MRTYHSRRMDMLVPVIFGPLFAQYVGVRVYALLVWAEVQHLPLWMAVIGVVIISFQVIVHYALLEKIKVRADDARLCLFSAVLPVIAITVGSMLPSGMLGAFVNFGGWIAFMCGLWWATIRLLDQPPEIEDVLRLLEYHRDRYDEWEIDKLNWAVDKAKRLRGEMGDRERITREKVDELLGRSPAQNPSPAQVADPGEAEQLRDARMKELEEAELDPIVAEAQRQEIMAEYEREVIARSTK